MHRSLTSRMGGTSVRASKRSVRMASISRKRVRRFSSMSAWALYARRGSAMRRSASRPDSASASSTFTALLGAAMASVMPSDTMLRHKTVSMIMMPGNSACHQRPANTPARASDRMLPQVGVGSGMPAAINESDASNTIASATKTIVNTKTGAMQLRTTCFRRIQGARAPLTMTART